MGIHWRKTLKVGTGALLTGVGMYRLFQTEEKRITNDPLAWAMIGFGTSHLLQEAMRVSEEYWNERQDNLQKGKNRYYPIL